MAGGLPYCKMTADEREALRLTLNYYYIYLPAI